MLITIVDVTTAATPVDEHKYEIYVNHRLITRFVHSREAGLSECLRLAADVLEYQEKNEEETLRQALANKVLGLSAEQISMQQSQDHPGEHRKADFEMALARRGHRISKTALDDAIEEE